MNFNDLNKKKKQRLLNLPGQKTLFNFSLSNSKDDNNNPVDKNTNTAIDKSTDHGDDINLGIDPESETQMSESNNKTTETESERSEHRKY